MSAKESSPAHVGTKSAGRSQGERVRTGWKRMTKKKETGLSQPDGAEPPTEATPEELEPKPRAAADADAVARAVLDALSAHDPM